MFEKFPHLQIQQMHVLLWNLCKAAYFQTLPLLSCFVLLCATGKQLRSCVQTDLGCLCLCWPQNLESREVIRRETGAVWVQASWSVGAEQELSTAYWLQCSATLVQLFCFQI